MKKDNAFDNQMKGLLLQKTSVNFTKKTMNEVHATLSLEKSYIPLLPKWVLATSAILVSFLLFFGLFQFNFSKHISSAFFLYLETINLLITYSVPFLLMFFIDALLHLRNLNS